MPIMALLSRLSEAHVAVIGDVMVDHYVHGAVQRISPEAPVPVLHVSHERHVLGGAANVAAGIAALGARATLVGLIGKDMAGQALQTMVADAPGITPDLVTAHAHPTIIKTRYLGDRQQIVRVDREDRGPYDDATIANLIARVDAVVRSAAVTVVSDYGKGALTDAVLSAIFTAASQAGRPVIVDPKRTRFADYRGATIITPNRKELEAAVAMPADSDEQAAQAAAVAIAASQATILMTRSEKGMSLFRSGAAPVHLPTQAREVFDVSGAGDTVVATLATALSVDIPIEQAMVLANAAAGVVVGKLGAAVCTVEELQDALDDVADASDETSSAGAATWQDTAALRERWRRQGLSVGFANGCFDLLHPGHVSLLQAAARQVDRLIVAINSDASVSRLKGPTRPVQSQDARAFVLAGLKGVDLVTVFDQDTPLELITLLVPDVLFKGADYAEADVVGGDVVKAAGGRVSLIDLVAGQSTSALVARANTKS